MSICNQKSTEVKQEDLTQIGSNSKPVKDVKFDQLMGTHKMNLTKTVNKASKANTLKPEDRLGTKNLGPTDEVHRDVGSTKEVHKETITTTPQLLTQEQGRKEFQPISSKINLDTGKNNNEIKQTLACNLKAKDQLKVDLQIRLEMTDILQDLEKIICNDINHNGILNLSSFFIEREHEKDFVKFVNQILELSTKGYDSVWSYKT